MSRVLKAPYVKVDTDNRVTVESTPPVLEVIEKIQPEEEALPSISADEVAESIIRGAERQAEDILQKANEEANRIIEEARAQAEMDAAKLFEQSKEQGRKEGFGIGTSEAEQIKADAKKIHDDTVAERKEVLENVEPEIVELISGIIDKLIGGALVLNPGLITTLVKKGLAETTVIGDVFVHVSPDDYEYVAATKNELLVMSDAGSKFEVLKDFSLNQSDCIIETPFGNIDCSLERQCQALKENLFFILDNR